MCKKGSKMHAILHQKCPRCSEGDLWKKSYIASIPYLLKGDYQMYDNCPNCDLKYDLEPGFWWGAMYVAYAFSSGVLLITGLLALFYFDLNMTGVVISMLVASLLGFSYNARLSRAVWLSMFVKSEYKKEKTDLL